MSEVKSTKLTKEQLNKLSLTELLARLDDISNWFNAGDVDVEQATTKFDEGVQIAEVAKARLAETENKVNQIKLKLEKIEDNE